MLIGKEISGQSAFNRFNAFDSSAVESDSSLKKRATIAAGTKPTAAAGPIMATGGLWPTMGPNIASA
uniref:Uncharacterized protein n=1 Tax=Romanomermis culicivorax TaxID=13658 RepID=A0A915L8Q2_ROMCU